MTMATRVVVIGEGGGSRQAVCAALAAERGLEVVAEAGAGDVAGGALGGIVRAVDAEVVVLDAAAVADARTLDALVLEISWRPPVVVLIEGLDDAGIVALVEAGARGFIRRGVPGLGRAVRAVARGEVVVDAELSGHLMPLLLRVNAQRLEATAALELARESLSTQVQELLETNAALELARESLSVQMGELLTTYRETVRALASAVELRDEYTGGHIERVADYALAIARELDPSLTSDPAVLGYMLHDIGKLALPDAVLFNAGPLTEEQFEVVKTHTVAGSRLVEGIPFLRPALQIVRNHHERWDGAGYPDRLAAEEIPPIVRVFTIADALDAITTDRPYQAARPLDFALEEIGSKAGSQFDPDAVAAFGVVAETDATFSALRHGTVPGRDFGSVATS